MSDTAVLPDVDVDGLLDECIGCEGNYPPVGPPSRSRPAEWIGRLPCGCHRLKCDSCLRIWIQSTTPVANTNVYRVMCMTCGTVLVTRNTHPRDWYVRL